MADARNSRARINCAIYTRKSSEEGLEKEFNSLDAQREACEAYIISQKHAGWVAVPALYDDGGLSGGTMERPALKRLLADIKAGKAHTVVVYKVDRLTRSLADFAKIVDILDAHDASFVSVTQQFNTTTSMGRLTLNMLLSFAQFEREIAGERIRDKIAASKAKGMWMGGTVPLGYDIKDRKLIINEAEAETVRLIFQRYAELGSVSLLRVELDQRNIRSKRSEGAARRSPGGNKLYRGPLYVILQNRLYRGEIAHRGNVYPGQHDAIIGPELWQIVQDRLTSNRVQRAMAVGAEEPSLLSGSIFDSDGHRMSPSHAVKKGQRYRYYVSAPLITKSRSEYPTGRRVPAHHVERLVVDRLRALFASEMEVRVAVGPLGFEPPAVNAILEKSKSLALRWLTLSPLDLRMLVRALVQKVQIGDEGIALEIDRKAVVSSLAPPAVQLKGTLALESLQLLIAANMRRAGQGRRIVIGDVVTKIIDKGLAALLCRAIAARDVLLGGADDSIDAMAAKLGLRRDYVTVLIRLSYLAPDIVKAVLVGNQPATLNASRLVQLSKDLPPNWQEQWPYLGFSAA